MNHLKRILLVEDDTDQLACLSTLLELNGYEVTAVPSGAEGLEALKSTPVDIVISDVAMPEMNGPSFVHHLRQLEGYSNVPVILLSSGTEAIDFSKVAFRADSFMLKKELPAKLLNNLAAL